MTQKQALLFCSIVFLAIEVRCQTPNTGSRFRLDLSLPFPIGNNFIYGYSGVADLGICYRVSVLKKIDLGLLYNLGLLSKHVSTGGINYSVEALTSKLQLNLEFRLTKLRPYLGLGYSVFNYFVSPPSQNLSLSNRGLAINPGLLYELRGKIYLNLQYDFIRFQSEKNIANTSFNRNIQILNVGVSKYF